jgi:AcrR family transcriptional regulator
MAQRENQRVKLTRRLIKESLIRLLAQESIYKVSVRALCQEAGVNRSTFYKYYGSPYDVLAELENDLLSSIQTALDSAPLPDADGERAQLGAICAFLEDNAETVRLLISNNVDPDFPEHLFRLPQIQTRLRQRLDGCYTGEEWEYAFTFLTSGCYRLMRDWIMFSPRKPAREMAVLLLDLIDKICTPRPPAGRQR